MNFMLHLAEVLSALIKNIAQTWVLVFTGGKNSFAAGDQS